MQESQSPERVSRLSEDSVKQKTFKKLLFAAQKLHNGEADQATALQTILNVTKILELSDNSLQNALTLMNMMNAEETKCVENPQEDEEDAPRFSKRRKVVLKDEKEPITLLRSYVLRHRRLILESQGEILTFLENQHEHDDILKTAPLSVLTVDYAQAPVADMEKALNKIPRNRPEISIFFNKMAEFSKTAIANSQNRDILTLACEIRVYFVMVCAALNQNLEIRDEEISWIYKTYEKTFLRIFGPAPVVQEFYPNEKLMLCDGAFNDEPMNDPAPFFLSEEDNHAFNEREQIINLMEQDIENTLKEVGTRA